MKIAIFGGTFDPIHIAHLIIAEFACCELSLDKLYFVPSATPPHKPAKTITSPIHRLNMLRLAIDDNTKFAVDEYEINKPGLSYTIDTLHYFYDHYPLRREDIYLLIGADNFAEFSTWKEPKEIVSLAQIVVAGRPRIGVAETTSGDVIYLHSPLMDVSASMIRNRIYQNKSICYLLPEKVMHYIHLHGLYSAEPAGSANGRAGFPERLFRKD